MGANSAETAKAKHRHMKIISLFIKAVSGRNVHLGRHIEIYMLVCAMVAATGSIARGDWTQYRFDPANHGVNPNETTLSPANVRTLRIKWRVNVGGSGLASASVANGVVYVVRNASDDPGGKLYALDRNTGQELWSFPSTALTGDFSSTTPAVANGIVYFGVNLGGAGPVVYAVNAATGVKVWSHSGPIAQIISSPNVIDGRVHVAFTDGTIRALDAATGAVIWGIIHPGGANSSPAIESGRLYISIHNQGLLALDANTGSELWLAPMPGPQWSSPAVENGRVFVGSRDDQKLYAFDAVTGQTLWTATTSEWVHSSPAVANGLVYVGNEAGDLYAFDAANGSLIWQTTIARGGIFNGPTVANGVIYVGAADGRLYAANAATGTLLFRGSVAGGRGGQVLASPVVDAGTVYIPAYDKAAVTAFGLRER